MTLFEYHNGISAQLGDTFQAPRWGTCKIIGIEPEKGATAINTSTGEVFDMLGAATFSESDFISRRQLEIQINHLRLTPNGGASSQVFDSYRENVAAFCHRSDALLFTAAADLLAACEAIAALAAGQGRANLTECAGEARAAIAKATGGQP